MLLFVKLTSGIGGLQRPESLFAYTRAFPNSLALTHEVVPLPPLSIGTHLGQKHRYLLSVLLSTFPCGIICIHHKNGFDGVGKRPELGIGMNLGGQACQEAWAQAGMVNTVKLLLVSQQSGLEVVGQEGLRTPLINGSPI